MESVDRRYEIKTKKGMGSNYSNEQKKRKPQQTQLKVFDRVPVQSCSSAALDLPKIIAKGVVLGQEKMSRK